MSPKIAEATIGEQRAMRQRQIIDAAMSLALESGAPSVTVAAVAKRAGISRSLVYEYFSSSADLIADLVLEELEYYKNRLMTAVQGVTDPYEYIELWISEALQYVADGRHLLVKSLNTVAAPGFRKAEIVQGHRNMMATIIEPIQEISISDLGLAVSYLQSAIDAAAKRIDAGNEAALEIRYAQRFAIAGLRALAKD
ncbi:AcrR Transcriptional regulator [Candidatus Planktophila dulcis]|uniref:TetR/AcrR family transcriptional regulator n=1 Tax=Candidatus Planktophila dulcis TaxID=1884914 RepID=UPI003BEEB953